MIAVINNISETRFELNGVQYPKTFLPFVSGDRIRIINMYDSNIELVPYSSLSDFTVDTVQFGTIALLQAALIPVLFVKSSLGGVQIDGDFSDITRVGNIITFTLDDSSEVIIDLNNLDQSTDLANHIADTNNPHSVTATQLSLGNVDNTSDALKPISIATQTALDNKVDKGFTVVTGGGGDMTNQWVIVTIGSVTYLGFSTVANPVNESDLSTILAAR